MAERTKAPVSKTGMGASSSWVRIPLSPPYMFFNSKNLAVFILIFAGFPNSYESEIDEFLRLGR